MLLEVDGYQVRRMRGCRGFSGAQFARMARISPKTLRRVELNRGPVLRKTARKIGAALEVDPRTFARAISRRPSKPIGPGYPSGCPGPRLESHASWPRPGSERAI